MPSFLDTRTATFYPWPQGIYLIPPDRPLFEPFFTSVGCAYYFEEAPETVRLPPPMNPGNTMSLLLRNGGSVEVEDSRGEHKESITLGAGELVTFTYISQEHGWMHLKI